MPKCIPAGVFYANKCSLVFGGVGRKLRLLTELLRNSRIFFAHTNPYWGVVRSLRSLPSFLRKLAVAYANRCFLIFGGVAGVSPAEGVAKDRLRAVARGRLLPPCANGAGGIRSEASSGLPPPYA